jgi:hypothetical protein
LIGAESQWNLPSTLNKCIHNMLLVARLEMQEAIFLQFASEYVAVVNSDNGFEAREILTNLAAAENGCCSQAAKSAEYASRRVPVIRPDYYLPRNHAGLFLLPALERASTSSRKDPIASRLRFENLLCSESRFKDGRKGMLSLLLRSPLEKILFFLLRQSRMETRKMLRFPIGTFHDFQRLLSIANDPECSGSGKLNSFAIISSGNFDSGYPKSII